MILARPSGDLIEIRFKAFLDEAKFRDCVDRIKRIEGRKYNANGGSSYWTIPASQQGYLRRLFERNEIEWEEEQVEVAFVSKDIPTDITYLDEFHHALYPFQVLGSNFLCQMKKGMIADEMGLGKTVQILAGIYKLYRMGQIKQALIVCPSTLKYEWETQLKFFVDMEKYGVKYIVIDGTPKQRDADYQKIKDEGILFTIINYELVLNDVDSLTDLSFDVIALDEGHRIKNWKGATSDAIKQLDAPYKWVATGTPMQNKPDELFNIFSWIDPVILGNWWKFRNTHIIIGRKFGQDNMVLGYKNYGILHKKIAPYMLRRLKKDVAPELPEMLITNHSVPMYKDQARIHDILNEDLVELLKAVGQYTERDENGNVIKQHPKADQVFGMFTMLQEVCDTPELLVMSESKLATKYADQLKDKTSSPKLNELIIILKDFIDSHDNSSEDGVPKAVVFTQYARMQRLIVEEINRKKLGGVEIVNGSMSALEKQEHIVNFKFNKEINFIICTDSANYGVNLQEASLLINFDIPWNPAIWQQRNARIHRINSTHTSVNIINLIATGGLDEHILDVLYSKQDMANNIIETRDKDRQHLSGLTHAVMQKLLKKKKKKQEE